MSFPKRGATYRSTHQAYHKTNGIHLLLSSSCDVVQAKSNIQSELRPSLHFVMIPRSELSLTWTTVGMTARCTSTSFFYPSVHSFGLCSAAELRRSTGHTTSKLGEKTAWRTKDGALWKFDRPAIVLSRVRRESLGNPSCGTHSKSAPCGLSKTCQQFQL
jgi:hypothetical protein